MLVFFFCLFVDLTNAERLKILTETEEKGVDRHAVHIEEHGRDQVGPDDHYLKHQHDHGIQQCHLSLSETSS